MCGAGACVTSTTAALARGSANENVLPEATTRSACTRRPGAVQGDRRVAVAHVGGRRQARGLEAPSCRRLDRPPEVDVDHEIVLGIVVGEHHADNGVETEPLGA